MALDGWKTTPEVVDILRVFSKRTVERWAALRRVRARKVAGGRWLIRCDAEGIPIDGPALTR